MRKKIFSYIFLFVFLVYSLNTQFLFKAYTENIRFDYPIYNNYGINGGEIFHYYDGLYDNTYFSKYFFEEDWGNSEHEDSLIFAGTKFKMKEFFINKGDSYELKDYSYGKNIEHFSEEIGPEGPLPLTEEEIVEQMERIFNTLQIKAPNYFNRDDFFVERTYGMSSKIYLKSKDYYILFDGGNGLEKVNSLDTNVAGYYYLIPYPKKFVKDAVDSFELDGKVVNNQIVKDNNYELEVNDISSGYKNFSFGNNYFEDENWIYSQKNSFCEIVEKGTEGRPEAEWPCRGKFKGLKISVKGESKDGNQRPKIKLVNKYDKEIENDFVIEKYDLGETIKDEAIWRDIEDGKGSISHVIKYKKEGSNYILHNGEIETDKIGEYKLEYSYTDTGGLKSNTVTRIVVISNNIYAPNAPYIYLIQQNGVKTYDINIEESIYVGDKIVDKAEWEDKEDGKGEITHVEKYKFTNGSYILDNTTLTSDRPGKFFLIYYYVDQSGLSSYRVTRLLNILPKPGAPNEAPNIKLLNQSKIEVEAETLEENIYIGDTIIDQAKWKDKEDGEGIISNTKKYKEKSGVYEEITEELSSTETAKYKLEYIYTDSGGLSSRKVTRILNVLEKPKPANEAPSIKLLNQSKIEVEAETLEENIYVGDTIIDQAKWKDKEDGEGIISNTRKYKEKSGVYEEIIEELSSTETAKYKLEYIYTDTGGLSSRKVTRILNILEKPKPANEKPTIKLINKSNVEVDDEILEESIYVGEEIIDKAKWKDKEDGEGVISNTKKYKEKSGVYEKITENLSSAEAAKYKLEYIYTDAGGLSSRKVTRILNILEKPKPAEPIIPEPVTPKTGFPPSTCKEEQLVCEKNIFGEYVWQIKGADFCSNLQSKVGEPCASNSQGNPPKQEEQDLTPKSPEPAKPDISIPEIPSLEIINKARKVFLNNPKKYGRSYFKNYPKYLPQTGVFSKDDLIEDLIGKKVKTIKNPLVETELPEKDTFKLAGSYEKDINFWKQVLAEQDKNEDKYIVLPKQGLVMPMKYLTEENEDYQTYIDGKDNNFRKYLVDGALELPGTSIYGFGEVGNKVIIGHSSYWKNLEGRYKTHFQKIIEADAGDEIWVYEKIDELNYKRYRYKATDSYETEKDDIDVIKPVDFKKITLITCTPIGGTEKRWILTGNYIEEREDIENDISIYGEIYPKHNTRIKDFLNSITNEYSGKEKNKKLIEIFHKLNLKEEEFENNQEIVDFIKFLKLNISKELLSGI